MGDRCTSVCRMPGMRVEALRHAPGSRRDAHEVELAQHLVVRRHLALALEDLDAHLHNDI